ncbi:MAG TPA: MCE family protein [Acidimicrobiales bacterium]|nr:MCE family protein [Acidimicrobiales bacterium]
MARRALAIVLALAALGLSGCSIPGTGGGGGYRLTAYFDKAISLYPQSSVKVLGLPAGRVTSIKVVGSRVRVTMRISDDVPVPADVQAAIVPLSLIGERYVQLFPAWTHGTARAKANAVIPLERTTIPVEPDEALAAVKHLLDSLDPQATGKLIKNLGDDLEGTGPDLNGALKGLGELTAALADRDDQLVAIVDHFDRFSATLATREAALGRVLDGFAATTGLLADERKAIERLVKNLASISTTGLDITSEHAAKLDRDLTVLTRTLQSVNVNIDAVRQLLDAAPLLVGGDQYNGTEGLAGAWDPGFHHIDLRNNTTPDLAQLFLALGVPADFVCVPVDVNCALPVATTTVASTTTTVALMSANKRTTSTPRSRGGGVLHRVARSLAEVFS